MNDAVGLLLVLVAIYLSECAFWLRRSSVAFTSPFAGRWVPVPPGRLFGSAGAGLLLSNPLPPLGRVTVTEPWPLSLTRHSVLAWVSDCHNPGMRPEQPGLLFTLDELKSVRASSSDLLINGQTAVRTGSEQRARQLAELVRDLAACDEAGREAVIEQALAASLDSSAIAARLEDFRRVASRLLLLCNLGFVYLFLVAPLLAWKLGFLRSWSGLLLAGLIWLVLTLRSFHRAHKALHPEARGERWRQLVVMTVAPPAALRAHDGLLRDLFAPYHPLAVCHVLCDSETTTRFARSLLLDLRHPSLPGCSEEPVGAQAAAEVWRGRLTARLERFLRETGLDPESLSAPPTAEDEHCRTYCPRCHAQYVIGEGLCLDCGGLELQPLMAPGRTRGD